MKQNRNQIKNNNVYNSQYSRLQQLNWWGRGTLPQEVWRLVKRQQSQKEQEEMVEMRNKPASPRLSFQPARTDIRENAAQMRRQRVHVSSQLYQVQPRWSILLHRTHTHVNETLSDYTGPWWWTHSDYYQACILLGASGGKYLIMQDFRWCHSKHNQMSNWF